MQISQASFPLQTLNVEQKTFFQFHRSYVKLEVNYRRN